jgi:hypothetical protein
MPKQERLSQLFEKYAVAKISARTIQEMLKDQFAGDSEWSKLNEEIIRLLGQQKIVEIRLREAYSADLDKLLEQTTEKKSAIQVLTDLAVSKLMKGELLEPIEYDGNEYQPEVKIAFKKIKSEKKKRPGRPSIRPNFYDKSDS